jgi:hypothetical protein
LITDSLDENNDISDNNNINQMTCGKLEYNIIIGKEREEK